MEQTLIKKQEAEQRVKEECIDGTVLITVIAYAMETTVINKKHEEYLRRFERKVIRTILGSS